MKLVEWAENLVARGQAKIGAYDKQLWEKSVEERVLKNWKSIAQVPKKNARVKAELIDVDLVRGSTFTKAKPQYGWVSVSRMGLLRLLFLPIFLRWWEEQTTRWFTALILLLYIMQVGATAVYITDSANIIGKDAVSLAHLTSPWILMLVLGLMHAQIVATRLSHKHFCRTKSKRRHKNEKRKRKTTRSRVKNKSGRESASQETGPEMALLEDESSSSRERQLNKLHASKRSDRLKQSARRKTSPCQKLLDHDKEEKEIGSTGSGANTEEDSPYNGNPRKTVRKVVSSNRFRQAEKGGLKRSGLCSIPTIMCNEEALPAKRNGTPVSYKGLDDSDTVSGCTSEKRETLNEPISEFTGQIIQPDNVSQDIQLTENLAIQCNKPSRTKDIQNDICPSMGINGQVAKDSPYYTSTVVDSGRNAHGMLSKIGGDASEKVSPKVLCCDEGILIDLSPKTEDKSPTEDFSISSTCSDSLLFDTRKPLLREAICANRSETITTSPHNITRTEGDGGATNTETDLEKAGGEYQKPEMNLLRRRCIGISGSSAVESDENKPAMKPLTHTDRLTVRVNDLKENLTGVSSCESEQDTTPNTPVSLRGQTSEYEWETTMHSDVTSSDTSSCSTESGSSDREEDPFRSTHVHNSSSVMNNLASSSDKVSCMIWEGGQVKKVDLTVLDISWTIIQKVDKIPHMCDYVVLGLLFSVAFTLMPVAFRAYMTHPVWPSTITTFKEVTDLCTALFGTHWRIQVMILNGAVQRFTLALIFFFLLSVADRTFKQRLLYAKNFCYLTSSRRAKKYDLPHFRLNKVRNIKTWLSLRSYLKKRGPQRSIDTIVSAAFILAVIFVSLMCLKLLQDSGGFLDYLGNWELVGWCMALAIYLLRFMTIGTKINRKYRNFSVLITEKINLYIHMEQKPQKKDELMLANNVLKLAEDLLKELESPFKISGLSANPFLYNVTKVIVLSAFSAVLTELLGFKLKLYKIKIKMS